MNQPRYSEEQRLIVRLMYESGATMTEIGAAIGTTRSGASGVVARLKSVGQIANRPSMPRTVKAVETRKAALEQPKPPKPHVVEPEAVTPHLTMLNVRDGQCRYPFGEVGTPEFHLCGHKTRALNSSWCEFHERKCFGAGTASERSAHRVSESGQAPAGVAT